MSVLQVTGRSMEPAFPDGRLIQGGRRTSSPTRGDVVVLRDPEGSARQDLKRVIGLPGERIAWDGCGRMWVNDQPLREPYARFSPPVPGDEDVSHVVLCGDEYFVAGDHRLHSRDSRLYGPVAQSMIMAQILSGDRDGRVR